MPDVNNQQQPVRTQADIEAELTAIEGAQHDQLFDNNSEVDHETLEQEALASRKGWTPKDKFKGPPEKWVDAKTFNERGDRFAKNLQREVESLKSQLAEFQGTAKAFAKFQQDQIDAKDAELKEAKAALRQQQRQAIRDGDDTLADDLDERIEKIDAKREEFKQMKQEPQKQPAEQQQTSAEDQLVLQEWIEDGNDWFESDEKLRNYAINIGQQMRRDGETAKGRKFLNIVRERMEEDFPRKFAKQQSKPNANRVESSDSGSSNVGGGNYSERDLPAEDLQLMKQFIAEGLTTKDKFLKSYFEDLRGGKRTHR